MHALHKAIVRHRDVGPHRPHQLAFGHELPGILDQVTKHREGLWAEVSVSVSLPKSAVMPLMASTRPGRTFIRVHPLRMRRDRL